MKIWIDLRYIHKESLYFRFILWLVEWLININPNYNFFLFTSTALDVSWERVFVNFKEGSFWYIDQFKFIRKIKEEKIDLMIFFSPKNMLFYRGASLLFLASLKEIFYTSEKSPFKRNLNLYFYKYALKHAKNIICFDRESKTEINARFDIREEKIYHISPSFETRKYPMHRPDLAKIAVNSRHALEWDYLIYDAGGGITRNIDRLIECIWDLNKKGHNISLLIIGEEASKDLILRQVVVKERLQTKVVFITDIKKDEEAYYYSASLWVVNSSFYDPLPLHSQRALSYDVPMVMSDLSPLKDIFSDSVLYFNPLSKYDMLRELDAFLNFPPKASYGHILQKFPRQKMILEANEVMKKSC